MVKDDVKILQLEDPIILDNKLYTVHDAILKHWKYFELLQGIGRVKLSASALCVLVRVRNEKTGINKTGNLPLPTGNGMLKERVSS